MTTNSWLLLWLLSTKILTASIRGHNTIFDYVSKKIKVLVIDMKCPIFCSLGFSVGNVIYNEKVSLTNSMGDTNSRELASPTELVSSSHSRVDELPLSARFGVKGTYCLYCTLTECDSNASSCQKFNTWLNRPVISKLLNTSWRTFFLASLGMQDGL